LKNKIVYNTFVPKIDFHSLPDRSRIVALIKATVPPGHLDLLRQVAEGARLAGMPLYAVGGFVRDLLLGRPALDFDLVVEGDAITLARRLSAKYGGKVTPHAAFKTAQWFLPKVPGSGWPSVLDLITARSETYPHPGALPIVLPGPLSDDLRRRDFTINTLAVRLDGDHFGAIRDDLGGLEDLEKGMVRVLHPNSYLDDPTRILRAVRYEQRYGFRILYTDLALIGAAKAGLGSLSGERLRHELDLVLAEEKAAAMLSRLAGLDVLTAIDPALAWDGSVRPAFEALDRPEPESWRGVPDLLRVPRRIALGYLIWLGDRTPEQLDSLAARLDFSAPLRGALLALSNLITDLPVFVDTKPSILTLRLDEVPALALCALSLKSVSKSVEAYLTTWRHIHAQTSGDTLIRRGMAPGPAFQPILGQLRAAWLDGEIKTNEEELALLDRLIKSTKDP
jgi:tRNA nucleotidyltransferase (CCA-adding enzyme)